MKKLILAILLKNIFVFTADISINNLQELPYGTPNIRLDIQDKVFYLPETLAVYDGRYYVFFWQSLEDELHLRVAYLSHSCGSWRALVKSDSKGHYFKGECYTDSLKIHPDILNFINSIKNIYEIDYDPGKYFTNNIYNELENVYHVNILNKLKKTFTFFGIIRLNENQYVEKINKLRDIEGFWPDFFNEIYRYKISMPYITKKDIVIRVYSSNFAGRDVEWHMAKIKKSKKKAWVYRVRFADSQISDYGCDQDILDMTGITIKPLDYRDQCSGLFELYKNKCKDDKYFNITKLTSINPIVSDFLACQKK